MLGRFADGDSIGLAISHMLPHTQDSILTPRPTLPFAK